MVVKMANLLVDLTVEWSVVSKVVDWVDPKVDYWAVQKVGL